MVAETMASNLIGIDERIVWDVVTLRAPSIAAELARFLAALP